MGYEKNTKSDITLNRRKKWWILVAGLLVILLTVAFFVIGNIFYDIAINVEQSKDEVFEHHDGKNAPDLNKDREVSEAWFLEHDVPFTMYSVSVLDHTIVGHQFIQPGDKAANSDWVVVVHGFTSSAFRMASEIKEFYEMGYNVLAPDLLASGDSEGSFISMGGYDSEDLACWCKYIVSHYPDANIALYGVSMGASTVINSLDENLPANVKLFIADSGYLSLLDEFQYELKEIYHLPAFPVIPAANVVTKIRAGFWFEDVDATEALRNTELPALIMQGSKDDFVPVYNAQKIYDLISSPKRLEIFDGVKHVKARYIEKERYFEIIREFLNEYM